MRHVLQLLPPLSFFLLKGIVEETILFNHFKYLAYAGIFLTILPSTLLSVDRKVDFNYSLFGLCELVALVTLVFLAVISAYYALAMLYLFDFSRISVYLSRDDYKSGIYINIVIRIAVNICLISLSNNVITVLWASIFVVLLLLWPIFLVGQTVFKSGKKITPNDVLCLFKEQSVYYGDLLLNGIDKLIIAGAANSVLIEYTYLRRLFQIANSIYLNHIRDIKVRLGRLFKVKYPVLFVSIGVLLFLVYVARGMATDLSDLIICGVALTFMFVVGTPIHFKFVYYAAPSIILLFNVLSGFIFNVLLILGMNVFVLFFFFVLLNIVYKYWHVAISENA